MKQENNQENNIVVVGLGEAGRLLLDCLSEHVEAAGLKTRVLRTSEASELAKLTETTYFGLVSPPGPVCRTLGLPNLEQVLSKVRNGRNRKRTRHGFS